jgi:hypothetical protein
MPLLTYPHCFLKIFCENLHFGKPNYSHTLFCKLRILISVQNDGHHGGFKFSSEPLQALSLCQVALLYLTNLHYSPILHIPLLPIPISHFPHLESLTSFSQSVKFPVIGNMRSLLVFEFPIRKYRDKLGILSKFDKRS